MMIKKKALAPNYYDLFSCIGSACEDNCCKDWDVDIDKNTYLKYKQIKDADFAREVPERVRRYRGKDASSGRYARIILDEKNTCKYFREDGLCEIHARYGPGYLSTTCQIYPRFVNFIMDDLPEMSLTM
ncbi:MAG: flagellin lysine-N-methylase, partial [Oscillospiraceae bacterium]|nr:flagellin lysine-N-methylase [Oscillospiraceae bacterium]